MSDNVVVDALKEPLDRNRVSYRKESWSGSNEVPYLEGHDVIETANRVFNFDWTGVVVNLTQIPTVQYKKGTKDMFKVSYIAQYQVTANGVTRTDVGTGVGYGTDPIEASDLAVKTAITDAMKRTFRTFGDQFGNCLYSSEFNRESEKIRNAEAPEAPKAKAPVKKAAAKAPVKAATKKAPVAKAPPKKEGTVAMNTFAGF